MANNMPRFDKYPLPGDSIVWRNGGFTLTASIDSDDVATPREFDCYSEDDIKRWDADEWCYVGIVVLAEYGGWLLGDTAASLWGLEYCWTEDSSDYLSDVAAELFAEALQVAKVELAKLRTITNTEE